MSKSLFKTHYTLNNPKSNFDVFRLEDLFELNDIDFITKNHKVNFYTILFITKNVGRHSIDFTDYYYSKGTLLAIRKDQIHKFYLNRDAKGFIFCFKEEFLNSYLNEIEVAKSMQMFNELIISPKTQLDDDRFQSVLNLAFCVEKEILNIKDEYSLKLVRSLIHILFTIIHRIKSNAHNNIQLGKYLKEFINFQNELEKNYSKTKMVSDYAFNLGFSTKKLNTIVKLVANKSAKVFIDETVIIKIKGLLIHSNDSIKEIAFKVGFKDPTNLFKFFKKFTNYTPEEFRKKNKV